MFPPILATKLYLPPPRPKIIPRPRLVERLNEGLSASRKLTLISAPAGFGKTSLVSEWISSLSPPPLPVREGNVWQEKGIKSETPSPLPVGERDSFEGKQPVTISPLPVGEGPGVRFAWLSLDEGDSDLIRFLTYLVAALQTIMANMGKEVLGVLQSLQPPSTESILTALINEITTSPDNFVLILDDYHVIDSKPVDGALTFLLEHLPPQMHLVIASREDPNLPLARLRARGQLTELRAADLRFTPAEAAEFLNQAMSLNLSAQDITALETRTEGWIAGLQLAAISMQGHSDNTGFIKSFTGSHHFVLDYLVEEVLHQQPESIQTFLLRTSILDRLCGPLCDAVLGSPSTSGQEILEYLERANLFIVPLDTDRKWYRYHHLFAELLRQRLQQSATPLSSPPMVGIKGGLAEYHIRASQWYEDNGRVIEAFQHAVAANDVGRAERLMEHKQMPLHIPGVPTTILNWLESLPTSLLNSKPALWWKQAAMMLSNYQTIGVEEKLQAAEAALASKIPPHTEMDEWSRNLVGKIAVARALLAQTLYQAETSLVQARRALEYLHPNNVAYRSTATQIIGFAYYLQGDRVAAHQAYTEALSLAQAAGDNDGVLMATIRLGQIHELRNQQHLAFETYMQALKLIGEDPPPLAAILYLGLARIYFEWNDLDTAEKYGEQSLQLARLCDQVIDRLISSELFLVRLKLARGDMVGAARILAQTEQTTRQKDFTIRLPDITSTQVIILLRQGNTGTAAQLARQYDLPLMQARVLIAQDDPSAALAVLEPLRQQAEEKGWADNLLMVMVVQSVALHAYGEKEKAVQLLGEALALAEPGGCIRLFLDEGEAMRVLIFNFRFLIEEQSLNRDQTLSSYIDKLLAAFAEPAVIPQLKIKNQKLKMPEPLSQRELKILQLIAQGLSNREIGERLFLALDTVKGHNRNIFDKLQVQSRTEAVARARELGLF